MKEFIVDDEEAEQELQEEVRGHRGHKKDKKKRKPKNYKIDDEDMDLINENTGIGMKKKSRLKKNAVIEAERNAAQGDQNIVKQEVEIKTKKDDEEMQIDTANGVQKQDRLQRQENRPERLEKQRLAVEIFGDSDEEDYSNPIKAGEPTNLTAEQQMDEIFNADEIDDPFSTIVDKRIAELDIPERLQVKLKDRLKPEDKELHDEAEWVLDRLTTYSTITSADRSDPEAFKYSRLLRQKDAKVRIFKVLSLIRKKCYDVPMVAKYRKYEYAEELDEEAIWIIFNLD